MKINKSCRTKLMYQGTWYIENDVKFDKLTICEYAKLVAPEGKFVSLIVNGIGRDIVPGTYVGDVVLALSDIYTMEPHALMRGNNISVDMEAAVVVGNDGADVRVPAVIQGGTIDGSKTDGVYMGTTAKSYNGIVITGDTEYTVKNSTFDFEGVSWNDFMGSGAAVAAIDNAKVSIEDSSFNFSGVTRCAVHAGGRSEVTVENCDLLNVSPDSDRNSDFSWQIALMGSNRLCQLADGAKATYKNCNLISNGWGLCSIDGTNAPVELNIEGCKMRLMGPRSHGYGAFCIGGNTVTIKDSDVEVNGYPMLIMGMETGGRPSIIGSKIRGRRFGAMAYSDRDSIFNIADSQFITGKSSLCVKGSNIIINMENTEMTPGNGTVLQLMDNDECGMAAINFVVPVGEVDQYLEGRNLFEAVPEEDVVLDITGCKLHGSLFNSTTNIRANSRSDMGGMGSFHDAVVGIAGQDDEAAPLRMPPMGGGMPGGPGPDGLGDGGPMPGGMPAMKDVNGPKNLGIILKNTRVEGQISSATQAYREGLTEITMENRLELSNVTQIAAPTVNNGVIVNLDGESRWTVTGISYLTSLTLAEGGKIEAPEGKVLRFTVDGVETALIPGTYQGKLVLDVI